MNDNKKSSQDFEFDFNNPKSTDKIVDQSMIKSRGSVDPEKIKVGAIGLFVFIVLGYYFFGSSVKKEAQPDHQATVVQPISKIPQDAAHSALEDLVAPMEEELTQDHTVVQAPSAVIPKEPEAAMSAEEAAQVAPPAPVATEKPVIAAAETAEVAPVEKSSAMPDRSSSVKSEVADAITAPSLAGNAAPVVDLSTITQQLEQHKKELQQIVSQQADRADVSQNNLVAEMRKYNITTIKRLDKIAKQQEDLMQAVNKISEGLSTNDAQLKKIEHFINAEIAEFAQPMGIVPAPVAPKYIVHAIIPGRAWLRDAQQRITSITEGQEVEGYGAVLTIDPKLGTVILSSGQVLRY